MTWSNWRDIGADRQRYILFRAIRVALFVLVGLVEKNSSKRNAGMRCFDETTENASEEGV